MAAWLDCCRYTPTLGGTTDWTFSSAVQGYSTPALAGVVNSRVYKYRAETTDQAQWEIGEGFYTTGTGVLTRTTVLANSSGTGTSTGQTGAGTKINFSTVPQIAIVALKEDLISIEEANAFSATQKLQGRSNIDGAQAPSSWTRQIFLSGSGTYTTPANCKAIRIRMVGGGGGGCGGDTGGGAGGVGGNTTWAALLTAAGGGNGGTFGNAPAAGGAASGGNILNMAGNPGGAWGPGAPSAVLQGPTGGSGPWGGAGYGGWPSAGGVAGATNSGSGGGGGGGNGHGGNSGAAGGYVEHVITSPGATFAYVVGAGGTAGTGNGGTSGAGGAGAAGQIIVEEYY